MIVSKRLGSFSHEFLYYSATQFHSELQMEMLGGKRTLENKAMNDAISKPTRDERKSKEVCSNELSPPKIFGCTWIHIWTLQGLSVGKWIAGQSSYAHRSKLWPGTSCCAGSDKAMKLIALEN